MGFDRNAPKKGLEICSLIKEGRAELSFTAYLEEEEKINFSYIEFQVWDQEGQAVMTICRKAERICEARGMLLYPHLWQSVEDPYIYQITACLIEGEKVKDEIVVSHAIYSFQWIPLKGCLLNGKLFHIRAVSCKEIKKGRNRNKKEWMYLLNLALETGANTICFEKRNISSEISEICERLGLVLGIQEKNQEQEAIISLYKKERMIIERKGQQGQIPELAGIGEQCLLTEDGMHKKDCFFYWKACWSKKPFVYLCHCWKDAGKGDTTVIHVFSNQPKVVLYVEKKVFEYRNGGPEFVFEDVPLPKEETIITVQAGNCYASTSILRQ